MTNQVINESSAICRKCGKIAAYTVNEFCEECVPCYNVDYEVIGAYMYFIWNNMLLSRQLARDSRRRRNSSWGALCV